MLFLPSDLLSLFILPAFSCVKEISFSNVIRKKSLFCDPKFSGIVYEAVLRHYFPCLFSPLTTSIQLSQENFFFFWKRWAFIKLTPSSPLHCWSDGMVGVCNTHCVGGIVYLCHSWRGRKIKNEGGGHVGGKQLLLFIYSYISSWMILGSWKILGFSPCSTIEL